MICATCETNGSVSPCATCGNDPLLVGKYELQTVLGRGAHGLTFLAQGPNGPCAIKELHLGRQTAGKATELFHREAEVLAQLQHEQIPTLYDHFVSGVGIARSLYVVQQYIPGQNLEERLKTHRFSEGEVNDIVAQVTGILHYLHALSPPVIHRDIKPSNLIISDDGSIHLIDFGAVRDVMRDSVGGGSTVAGTFGYMAPEQLVGDATPQSDLYALGMTAIRLLTREHPTGLTNRLGQVDWRSRSTVSDETAYLINGLVHSDPIQRRYGRSDQANTLSHPSPKAASRAAHFAEVRWANASDSVTLWERVIGIRRTHIETEIPRSATLRDAEDAALLAAYHGVFPTLPTLHAHYGPSLDQHGWLIGDPMPETPTTRDRCKARMRIDSEGETTRIQLFQQHHIQSRLLATPKRLVTSVYAGGVVGYTAIFLAVAGIVTYLNYEASTLSMVVLFIPGVLLALTGGLLMVGWEFQPDKLPDPTTAADVQAAISRLHTLARAIDDRLTANNSARLPREGAGSPNSHISRVQPLSMRDE